MSESGNDPYRVESAFNNAKLRRREQGKEKGVVRCVVVDRRRNSDAEGKKRLLDKLPGGEKEHGKKQTMETLHQQRR